MTAVRLVVGNDGDGREAGGVGEEVGFEGEEIGAAGRDQIEKIAFISLGAIGGGGLRLAVGMRMEAADDARVRVPRSRRIRSNCTCGSIRKRRARSSAMFARLVDGERAPAVRRLDAFDQAAAFVRIGARGRLQHARGKLVGKMERARGHGRGFEADAAEEAAGGRIDDDELVALAAREAHEDAVALDLGAFDAARRARARR